LGEQPNTRSAGDGRGVAFLEDLSRRNFRYFEEQTNRETGLCSIEPGPTVHRTMSIIATLQA